MASRKASQQIRLRPIDFSGDIMDIGLTWITETVYLNDRDPIFHRFNAMVWAMVDAGEWRDAQAEALAGARAYRRLVSSYDREFAEFDDEFFANWLERQLELDARECEQRQDDAA